MLVNSNTGNRLLNKNILRWEWGATDNIIAQTLLLYHKHTAGLRAQSIRAMEPHYVNRAKEKHFEMNRDHAAISVWKVDCAINQIEESSTKLE